ncbi:glycosyltransferase family 4 protein [Cesiribacter sp. SM1]|uniref:glycosyltransferase family 4 protein n=1 Tax=Cesiribacter sp. SM1 TaxID=2861196 RepID=UPI001CD474F8|nr:glycosyltransferase [Cesiribacter sp. SM1]
MKKILVFIDWYEPGYRAGGPIRSIKNLVDYFKGEACFYIITRNIDYQSTVPYNSVISDAWNQVEPNVSVYYCSQQHLGKRTFKRLFDEQEWDIIYINGIYSWFFSLLPLWLLRGTNSRIVVAPRGMLAAGALGVKSLKKNVFLWLARKNGFFRDAVFHATHAGEADEIKRHLNQEASIVVAPNLAAQAKELNWQPRVKQKGVLRMVSIARISPEKNTKYGLEILKSLASDLQVEYHLYGPINDQQYWQECQEVISKLPPHASVEYKGSLANDHVASTLKDYHVLCLPSRGENFGHVILEALTAAIPVLISDRTPWRGLIQKQAGWDLPLETPEQFSFVIEQLAQMEQTEYDSWSRAAFALAVDKILDEEVLHDYRRLLEL